MRTDTAMRSTFHVRLLPQDRRKVEEAARASGVRYSDFIRQALSEAADRIAA